MGEGRHARPKMGFKFRNSDGSHTEEDRATEVNIRDSKDTVTTKHGLQWNSTNDVLAVPATRLSNYEEECFEEDRNSL